MENKKDRVFAVELQSKQNIKNLTLTNRSSDNVLLEGNLGELVQAKFTEGVILEVVCKDGLLRIDLSESEILRMPQKRLAENAFLGA